MSGSVADLPATPRTAQYLRWRLAIPPEKGGWIWWMGPFVVGALAGSATGPALLLVLLGAFAAFCFRQPLTLLMRQLRRNRLEGSLPLLFWTSVYALVLIFVGAWLLSSGYGRVAVLGLAGAPVFVWHLALVYLGRERHQRLLDLSAAAALALVGPAAYFACGGQDMALAFWIWALPALQSCASIIHMFLRLEQRALRAMPSRRARVVSGVNPMLAHLMAFTGAGVAAALGHAAPLVLVALAIPLLEGGYSVLRPQVRQTPKQLGMRQLAVSTAAMLLIALGLRGG